MLDLGADTLARIQEARDPLTPFRSDAQTLGGGRFAVPVDEQVFGRLNEIRFEGETDDDVILRMLATFNGRKMQ